MFFLKNAITIIISDMYNFLSVVSRGARWATRVSNTPTFAFARTLLVVYMSIDVYT